MKKTNMQTNKQTNAYIKYNARPPVSCHCICNQNSQMSNLSAIGSDEKIVGWMGVRQVNVIRIGIGRWQN